MQIVEVKIDNEPKHVFCKSDLVDEIVVGSSVVVNGEKGLQIGVVKKIVDEADCDIFKDIIRIATSKDLSDKNNYDEIAKNSKTLIKQKMAKYNQEMKLIDVEFLFDGSKLIIYFTCDNRVDFRLLVKDLAAHFRTRIEMRQINTREAGKILGGISHCGRKCCCSEYAMNNCSISIKMAKNQNLFLLFLSKNPIFN